MIRRGARGRSHRSDERNPSLVPRLPWEVVQPRWEAAEALKLHWLSNGMHCSTGYGVQSKLFLPRIQKLGHEITTTDFYGLEGGIQLDGLGIRHYPKGGHPYGQDVVGMNMQHAGAEVLITLIDAWVMEPQNYPPGSYWCPWFPVDSDPIPPPVLNKIRAAFRPIAYAKFGVEKCKEAGIDAAYVPHGVDTKVYRPIGQDTARETLGWRKDMYIVGMVAANKGTPSRKSYPQALEAFARFHKDHPDAVLYLHTTLGENGHMQGVNLPELVRHLGLQNAVLFPDQFSMHLGFNDEYMVNVFNAIDVLLSPSMGEGFGVPILEAQACGTPVIAGDWTAMPEITRSGHLIPLDGGEPFWTPLASYQFLPRISAIVDALETMYGRRGTFDPAQVAANVAEYDADYVTEAYWKPVLEEIGQRIAMQKQINGMVSIPATAQREAVTA